MQSIVENLAHELELVKQNERKLIVQTKVSETVDSFIQSTSDILKTSITDMLNKYILMMYPKDRCVDKRYWDKSIIKCNLPHANTYRNTFGYKIRDQELTEAKTDDDRLRTNIEYDIKTFVNERIDSWIDSINGKMADYIRTNVIPDIDNLVESILKRETILEVFTERRLHEILNCSFDTFLNKDILAELVRTALSEAYGINDDTVQEDVVDPEHTNNEHHSDTSMQDNADDNNM